MYQIRVVGNAKTVRAMRRWIANADRAPVEVRICPIARRATGRKPCSGDRPANSDPTNRFRRT